MLYEPNDHSQLGLEVLNMQDRAGHLDLYHKCTMCPYGTDSMREFTNHVSRVHKNDPRFRVYCDIGQCGYTTKSWGGFKAHLSRYHKYIDTVNEAFNHDDTDPMPMEGDDDCDDDILNDENKNKMFFASYLLNLESTLRLSEKAVSVVAENTKLLLDYHLTEQKKQFKRALQDQNIDTAFVDTLEYDTCISGMATKYQREKYFKSNCFLVEAKEITLGQRNVLVNGHVKRVHDVAYFVPLEEELKSLLRMPEVRYHITHPHQSNDEYMRDIWDGNYVKTHPVFGSNRKALMIQFYSDDLEIVNPLGPHIKKHKVTMFYWVLVNIPPEDRSRLQAISVYAVAKAVHLKRHGMNSLLNDFIVTINKLSSDGIEFDIDGNKVHLKGGLVANTGDTPGNNHMGGFKESPSFALLPCKSCLIEHNDLPKKLTSEECQPRTLDHLQKCALLFDQPLSKAAKTEWSKRWGINHKSVLLDVEGFDLCKCLLEDPQHVFLEGVVPYEMGLFLYYCIEVRSFFSLAWLNNQLAVFPYSYLEKKDKPEPIQRGHYYKDCKIKQNSACILTLCSVIPYILCKKVPHDDSKFSNLLLLFEITHLCTSPCVTATTAVDLKYMIKEHHTNFKIEYPRSSFIPKLHFMIHFPEQILRFGPGRMHWCMRYEGKHSQSTAIKWKNFRNLPKSIIAKHQKWMCAQRLSPTGQPAENFLYEGDVVVGGRQLTLDQLTASVRELLSHVVDGIDVVYQTDRVVIHGNDFRPGCVLIRGYDGDGFPQFIWLSAIYVVDHQKYMVCKDITITGVEEVVNSYEINVMENELFVTYSDLFIKMPLPVHLMNNRPCVCNKYGHQSLRQW